MKTVQQLLTPASPEDTKQVLTAILAAQGFGATSWEAGSFARTFVEMLARLYSDFTVTLALIVRSRYNSEATGDWLTLLSASEFENYRYLATTTVLDVRLVAGPQSGPYTLAVGDSILVDTEGRTFRNTSGGVVPFEDELLVRYQADVAGPGKPLALTMQTPLAGVTMEFVAYYRTGSSEETDARLRLRNVTRWATLSYAGPEDAYKKWALEVAPSVTRVRVDAQNPAGSGSVDVYLAGEIPLVGGEDATVLDYINGEDGVGRRPLGSTVRVLIAEPFPVTVAGTVYYDPLYSNTVEAETRAALIEYFKTLPIGGYDAKIPVAGIYGAVMRVRGVVNMALTQPLLDIPIALVNVATLNDTTDPAFGGGLQLVPVGS